MCKTFLKNPNSYAKKLFTKRIYDKVNKSCRKPPTRNPTKLKKKKKNKQKCRRQNKGGGK